MRNLYGLIAVVLLVLISIPAYAGAQVPDHLSVVVADPVLVANGMDATSVTVTVYDSENNTISDLPVYFFLENNELGMFSPGQSNTSASGTAETQFQVKKVSGLANFSVRVEYGTTDFKEFPGAGQIHIQNPIPDTIWFNTTKEWLVANGTDSAFARVVAYNQTYPIPNLGVNFHILEPEMGTFQPDFSITNIDGTAQSLFRVKYKSGNATLKAFIRYEWEGIESIVERQYIQKIDHDTPYSLSSYNVPSEVSVGSITPLIMTYRDRWGNPVDDRRIAENVTFMVSSPMEDALFVNTSSMVAIFPVNYAGEAIAWLQASLSPSINVVRVDPDMGTIPDKYFFIQAIANRSPVRIVQLYEPEGYMGNPPKLYADGNSRFSIEYTVTDEYQNGVMNTPVEVTTWEVGTGTKVEERIVFTNSFGQALLTYGPKSSIGKYRIVARAIGNTTSPPSCEKEVWFVSQEAEDMQFTAVPDSMASSDLVDGTGQPAWEPAMLMAKVIDDNGNPVEGETVTFSMGTPVYEETPKHPIVTADPELVTTNAVTDSEGFAIVLFNPGAFTTNWTDPDYDDTASGSCTVTAHWENVTRGKSATQSLVVTWKNYPYLSIETAVSPQTVNVSGTVNVKVSMRGDGWALRPKPIDAVLCTDRSGSMLKDNPDRMVSVMSASKAFVGTMHVGPTRDHIGLVSFGHKGIAKLAPVYTYLSGTYYCYGTTTRPTGWTGTWYSGWRDRPLQGWFWDWTGMYGVTSNQNSVSSTGFLWVYQDSNWDMPTTYNYQNVWPYTYSYDAGSAHQTYVNTYYPNNNRNYAEYAVVEQTLTANPAFINASINSMVPVGGTPMRYGIYRAINEIRTNGRTNAIRAVIVLGDGDYNWYGDPLARGTAAQTTNPEAAPYRTADQPNTQYWPFNGLTGSEQNLSNYAINNNIRIYSIGYGEDITEHSRNTLRILAESTGGQYFNGSAANIEEIYKTIAGQLQEEAGVDTMMDLGYDQIEVNYNVVTVDETYKVFSYVPDTDIDSYYQNQTRPTHDPPYPYSIDQSDEFNETHKLNFSVGTVKLGQTWEAIYTLQVLVDGNINVFGENSQVYFNGTQGPSQLRIPKTYITGVPNMTSAGVNSSTLSITVGTPSESGPNIITWPIYRNYTGNMSVKEDYYISTDDGMNWLLVGFRVLSCDEAKVDGYYSVNRNFYPPEAVLRFRVVGNALDAPGPVFALSPPPPPAPIPGVYIFLK